MVRGRRGKRCLRTPTYYDQLSRVHVGMDARVFANVWVEHEGVVRFYHRTARRLMGTEAAAGDLEHRATLDGGRAERPAFESCTEQVAVAIGDQASQRF